jgi:hypothetical protein
VSKDKIPTLEEKVLTLNMFVHTLSICKNNKSQIERLLKNADEYSRACDRIGSDTGLEKEIKVARAFWKLCDTSEK